MLRNYFILKILLITLCAYFLAKGAASLLTVQLRDAMPSPNVKTASPEQGNTAVRPRRTYRRRVRGDAVLARNLFDSALGPLSRTPPPPVVEDAAEGEAASASLVPCTASPYRLEATLAVDDAPSLSMAAVSKGRTSDIYREGDALGDDRIELISWQYLILDDADGYCYLDLFDVKTPDKRLSRKAIKKGIERKGALRRVVDRSLYKRLLNNPSRLIKGINARPYHKGKINGYKIRRVSRSHPAYMLGLRKNDIVKSVNGQRLTAMGNVLAVLDRLEDKRRLKVDLVRRGRERELDIRVQ